MLPVTSSDRSSVDGEVAPAPPCPALPTEAHSQLTPLEGGRSRRGRVVALLGVVMLLLVVSLQPARAELGDETTFIHYASDYVTNISWGDMDADGDLDAAFSHSDDTYDDLGRIAYIYKNEDSGFRLYWQNYTDYRDAAIHGFPSWGDLDGDGDLDVAFGPFVFSNIGSTFVETFVAPVNKYDVEIRSAWVDYDGDSDFDLSVGGRIYSNSNGILSLAPAFVYDGEISAWGDMDFDGDQDMALISSDKHWLQIYANNGVGQLSPFWGTNVIEPPYVIEFTSIAWADLELDGDLDLAASVIEPDGQLYSSVLFENLGTTFGLNWHNLTDAGGWNVAWGDENNDDFPELALAYCVEALVANCHFYDELPLSIYHNQLFWVDEEGYEKYRSLSQYDYWRSKYNAETVEWVDSDSDGDIDLSTALSNHFFTVYRNEGIGLTPIGAVDLLNLSEDIIRLPSLAWGNLDADADIELAIGSTSASPAAILDLQDGYYVVSQTLADDSESGVALGDWDGDNDLDLAIGEDVYRNNSGSLSLYWSGPNWVSGVSWADWDGDGDLELTVEDGSVISLYQHDQGAFTQVWQYYSGGGANDFEWGDWDNDGDLDLAIALGAILFEATSTVIFENTGGQLVEVWESPPVDYTRSLAWGDWDSDGDLDLAMGNSRERSQVYSNNEGKMELVWESSVPYLTEDISWVDYNNDGDLDLTLVAYEYPVVIYDNHEGTLSLTSELSDPYTRHRSPNWIDWGADGDLDLLAVADSFRPEISLEENKLQSNREPSNNVLGVLMQSPTLTAEKYGASTILGERIVPIQYTIQRHNANTIGRIEAFYSLNGGGQWLPAVADVDSPALGSTQLTHLPADADGTDYTFYWDTYASGVFGLFDNVVFRIDVYAHADDPAPAGTYEYPTAVSRSYQRPARVSARTTPFRVRGTQVQVMQQELQPGLAAAPGAIVYRLKPGETKATAVGNGADRVFTTDSTGHLQGHGELNPGDKLVALWPAPEDQQPPAGYPYTLYYTSAPVTAEGLQMQPVTGDGTQVLRVSADNPLILFDLVVSLEWDARNDPTFLRQLENDIGRASEILYDLTDGQAALGSVHLYHDKGHWGVANVVIPAGNHIRPAATLGGIVPQPQPDTAKNGTPIEDAFVPGQVRIGPTWNRFGDAEGTLGEDWPRTLAHELGHYLFYLPDNYLGIQNGALALVNCVGSAMSDPYRADYSEFLPRARWTGGCLNTVAEFYLGRADWQTIDRAGFYPALKTPAAVMDGPATLPLQVTRITPFAPEDPPDVLAAPFFNIADASGSALAIPQGRGQAYLIKRQRGAAANDPTARYVVELGAPVGPLLNARGAAPGDALCVFDYSVGAADTRLGCVTVGQNPGTIRLTTASNWRPVVTVTGRTNTEKTVDVVVSGAGGESAMTAQLLPALGAASPEVPMTRSGQNWQATLTVPDGEHNAAFYGYVRVWASAGRQTIVPYTNLEAWDGYAYAWGGYAYAWGNPPSAWGGYAYAWGGYAYAWGGYAYAWGAPIMSGDGQVSFLPQNSLFGASELLSLQSQPAANLDPWLTQVGQAYRLRALDNTVPPGSILFRYLARDVPDGMEDHLTIYYQAEGATTWQRLSSTRQPEYNHVAAPAQGPGTYALVATVEMTRFEAGWNVFAYPIAGAQPVGAALASLGDKYTSVLYFNNALDRWQVYDRTVAAEYTGLVNTLTELRYGEAYWLYATAPVTLYLSAPTSDAPLPAPPNRYFPPATYYGTVTPGTGFTPAAGDALTATIGSAVCGQTTLAAQGAALVYAVQVQAEALVGAADGCGRDGRAITFTVRGVALTGPTAATWNNTQAHLFPLTGSSAPPAPQITDFNPKSGPVGAVVTLTGANLSNATVRFNGVAATVSSNTATQIQAAVPAGATDGFIEVTAGGQTATTATPFDVTTPPVIPDVYYLSVAGTGSYTLGNLAGVKQADVVEYTHSTNTWRMVYQGSHASHNTPKNVAAFAMLGDGSLLLVFGANQGIGGVTYTPLDIVKFTPNAPNSFPLGAGSYTMWLDGDKVGLAATGEKIDGLAASANGGTLHISTVGAAKVPKPGGGNVVAADEDVMTLTRNSATSGAWSATLRLDGSAVGNLGASDVNAYWEDAAGSRYLTVLGATPVDLGGGVLAYPKNIVKLTPNGGGWTPSIVSWLASGTLPANLDGLEIKP